MKYLIVLYYIIEMFHLTTCNPKNKLENTSDPIYQTSSSLKTFTINGNWEAYYIINLPKEFDELYPMVKPSITFTGNKNKISGISGCNRFKGNFKIEGQRIFFGKEIIVTKKMCTDMTGEKRFLETIKGVNSFSLTENGNTINLIMGDIAVMKLKRI